MNNRKNSAGSGKKKELIFHHEDFLRGREDLVACMQTVKKDNKDKMKKSKVQEPRVDEVESSSICGDEEEGGIEIKVDRIDSKMDGIHLKLDELTHQIQSSLAILLAASSNTPDYQPIPLNEKNEFHHHAKRRRWDGEEEDEAKMPSRIQLQSVNNGNSQLTLDTDEMNVIQTLMDCDDDDDDNDGVKEYGNYDTTTANPQTAKEPKVEMHTLVNAEVVDEVVDHVYIAKPNQSKNKWYKKKKYILAIASIILLTIFTGVLVGLIIQRGNNSNYDSKEDDSAPAPGPPPKGPPPGPPPGPPSGPPSGPPTRKPS